MALSLFSVICLLHSLIAITTGTLMMFYMKEIYTLSHGIEAATKLLGSTPHDQLLIRISDSFSGLLLFAIGFLLFMVAFVKDRECQIFFAKGCVALHVSMAVWRFNFERRVEDLAWDWLRQIVVSKHQLKPLVAYHTFESSTKQKRLTGSVNNSSQAKHTSLEACCLWVDYQGYEGSIERICAGSKSISYDDVKSEIRSLVKLNLKLLTRENIWEAMLESNIG